MPNDKAISFLTSPSLVHQPKIFLLQLMALTSGNKLSKNNLEVNL